MKKTLIALSLTAFFTAVLLTGCKKDTPDNTAPVIYLSGNNPDYDVLGFSYSDAGATATDNVDGSVVVTTTGTVNKDIAGDYTLTYTAKDAAGNSALEVSRKVSVVDISGPYAAKDTCDAPGTTLTSYSETISITSTS